MKHTRTHRTMTFGLQRLITLGLALLLTAGFSSPGLAETADIIHPIMNPPQFTTGNCPDCGMVLNMYARTRHDFTDSEGAHETCSIRCMADLSMKSGEPPKDARVALYLEPETMIAAEKAMYVVGSKAPGTMTMVSKLAFADEDAAKAFAAQHGGEVMPYAAAYEKAAMELEKSRAAIGAKRISSGKIKEPGENDHCQRCGMFPARHPAHRSQILTTDGATLHFCSTQCLINHQAGVPNIQAIWVTVYPDGDYDYAGGLYYVVGSKMQGPMGYEALPFRKKAGAAAFAAKEGGQVVRYPAVTPSMLAAPGQAMEKKHH